LLEELVLFFLLSFQSSSSSSFLPCFIWSLNAFSRFLCTTLTELLINVNFQACLWNFLLTLHYVLPTVPSVLEAIHWHQPVTFFSCFWSKLFARQVIITVQNWYAGFQEDMKRLKSVDHVQRDVDMPLYSYQDGDGNETGKLSTTWITKQNTKTRFLGVPMTILLQILLYC
jgi:hypothetical protein